METFSASLAICAENSPVPGEFPAQRPETRSFDVFLDLRLNKRLSKQSWGCWFETPSRSLWRHCNGAIVLYLRQHVSEWVHEKSQQRNSSGWQTVKAKEYEHVYKIFLHTLWTIQLSVAYMGSNPDHHCHGGTTEEGNCSYLIPLSHRDCARRVFLTSSILCYFLVTKWRDLKSHAEHFRCGTENLRGN